MKFNSQSLTKFYLAIAQLQTLYKDSSRYKNFSELLTYKEFLSRPTKSLQSFESLIVSKRRTKREKDKKKLEE